MSSPETNVGTPPNIASFVPAPSVQADLSCEPPLCELWFQKILPRISLHRREPSDRFPRKPICDYPEAVLFRLGRALSILILGICGLFPSPITYTVRGSDQRSKLPGIHLGVCFCVTVDVFLPVRGHFFFLFSVSPSRELTVL